MVVESGPVDAAAAVVAGGRERVLMMRADAHEEGSGGVGRRVATHGDVDLAVVALVARRAAAAVAVLAVLARGPVLARVRLALVDVHLALAPLSRELA